MVWHEELLVTLKIIWDRVIEIIKEPILHKEMLWVLLPLLVALFLIELYFAFYKEEELGWNTAVSNSLVLFFVGMNLCSFLYSPEAGKNMLIGVGPSVSPELLGIALKKSIIAYFVIFESISLLILNFFHLLAKKFAFGISSGLILNYIGIVSIILVYSPNTALLNELVTLPAILVLFVLMVLFFLIIKALFPPLETPEAE